MLNFTYVDGHSVPGIKFNGTVLPGYYLPNGTLWPAGYYANGTMILPDDCTYDTCNLETANMLYVPGLAENVILAAIFAIFFVAHVPLGIRYRTWGYTTGALFGLALEVIGYIGRVMMNNNIFTQGPFIIYLCCLTIAPAFLTAAIYLCLGRIITVYGNHIARFRPFVYTVMFMLSDFLSLVLQGAGGGIASTGDTKSSKDLGVNLMIAGLVFQVVSLVFFMVLCADFAWATKKNHSIRNPAFTELRNSRRFKAFLFALGFATLTIFIRSIYRTVELWAGFDSALANNHSLFVGLESVMLVIAGACLTCFHPGWIYGKANWAKANFKMNQKKAYTEAHGQPKSQSENSDSEMQPIHFK